jgi:CBS domain-containing protein
MILDIKVGSLARHKLVTIEENESVQSAVKVMVDNNIGSLVVTKQRKPVGIVTERDMLKKVLGKGVDSRSAKVRDIMTADPITIDGDRPLADALDLMNRKGIRRMLVTENDEIVGIFTQRDVVALNRLCLQCGKEIKSVIEYGKEAEPYIECQCGSRYHTGCAKTVVHCVDCSRTLVTTVIYPEPSETMGG